MRKTIILAAAGLLLVLSVSAQAQTTPLSNNGSYNSVGTTANAQPTESIGGGREVSALSWKDRKKNIAEAKKASGSGWALVTPTSYWWAYDQTRRDFHERVRRSMSAASTGIWQGETLRDIAEAPRAKLSTKNRSVLSYARAKHVDLARLKTRWRFNASGSAAIGSPFNSRNDYQGEVNGNWN